MGRLLRRLKKRWEGKDEEESSGEEVQDVDAIGLSHVAAAAYEELRTHHNDDHHNTWDVTTGKVVGELDQTPKGHFSDEEEPPEGHSDWFPEKMGEIISRTEYWCDIMSLGPPDGLFMDHIKAALETINERADPENPVVIRMLLGNIIGMPTNCTKIVKTLTADLGDDPGVLLWVGAWRNGVSWNHAKLIAVDGKYLHTGGHNLWDRHYLKQSPVHDLSLEMEGKIAHCGHLFANEHWHYIGTKQKKFIGMIIDRLPDAIPMVLKQRVTITEFPEDEAGQFPPMYRRRLVPTYEMEGGYNMLAIGRKGQMGNDDKAADDAFIAMINSAQTILRLGLQDIGPVCFPGTKRALPGCKWPKTYLSALGRAIWEKGVDVEIVLSNPGSIPGGLSGTEANYGNGWSCVDVAAEIIKTIRDQFPDAEDDDLRQKVEENLRICFIRTASGNVWADGNFKGLHSKHFIVDDICCYIGSQNLYVCDLAEWGVVIDDPEQTQQIKAEYWDEMWNYSYTGEDVDVHEVMDGLDIDRDGEDPSEVSNEQLQEAALAGTQFPSHDYVFDHESDSEKEEE